MESREYLKIGLRLLGVYFLIVGLSLLPAIYGVTSSVVTEELDQWGRGVVVLSLSASIKIVAGALLIVRTGLIAGLISRSEKVELEEYRFEPSDLLRLLGIYLMVVSIDGIYQLIDVFFSPGVFSVKLQMIGPSWITFCVGVVLTIWTRRIWKKLLEIEERV